jgi:adenylate kinase family enzyme
MRRRKTLSGLLAKKLCSCHTPTGELNRAEVARRAGISRQYLHQVLQADEMPHTLVGLLLENFKTELTLDDIRPYVRFK